jgi:hypothetical protein
MQHCISRNHSTLLSRVTVKIWIHKTQQPCKMFSSSFIDTRKEMKLR